MPAYNAEAFIGRALQSIAGGRVLPAEVIVVDDASTDRTAELSRAHGARVISLPANVGPSGARNLAVAAAQFPWIAFLDADDQWREDKLSRQWAALSRWPDAGYCFTDYDVVRDDGTVVVHSEMGRESSYRAIQRTSEVDHAVCFDRKSMLRGLVQKMFIRQSSVLVRRELFERCGGYDERLRLAEDYDLFLRLACAAPAIAIEAPLVRYVRREGSLSADPLDEVSSIDQLWETIAVAPERYAVAIRELAADQRAGTLCSGALRALRLGRTAEALAFSKKALRVERSPRTLASYALSRSVHNRAGRAARSIARSVWRLRHRHRSVVGVVG